MIQETELSLLLHFDLETSSDYASFDELEKNDIRKSELWITKCKKAAVKDPKWEDHKAMYVEQAPLSAEFGRIVCGSFGYLVNVQMDGEPTWKGTFKSFYDTKASKTSEVEQVLIPIANLLSSIDRAGKPMRMCGHNIKKFDIPWLVKRLVINNIPVPPQLQIWGKKPWEINHLDTGELWALGNWEGYVSLDVLTCILDIPSPKANMKGEYVGINFHKYKKYEEIKDYCEQDVKAVAKICHKLTGSKLPIVV